MINRPSTQLLRSTRRPVLMQTSARLSCRRLASSLLTGRFQICSHPLHSVNRRRCCRLSVQAIFTGIVQGTATVLDVRHLDNFRSLVIQFPAAATRDVQIGASIALMVTGAEHATGVVGFDVIQETLRATNLGELQSGSTVNFERSARVGDEIGGHNVAGHIHTTAVVQSAEQTANNVRLMFQVPQQWIKYIFPKGYIAVDGISLTVGEVGHDSFCVYLIPETLRATTLGSRQPGQTVNIEIETQTQTIVDTVEKVLAGYLARTGPLPQSIAAPVKVS